MDFQSRKHYGNELETALHHDLEAHGWKVIAYYLEPDYRYEGAVVPDILATRGEVKIWIEAKRKKRMLHYPATGIEERLVQDYLRVQALSGIPVYLYFKDGNQNYWGRLDAWPVYDIIIVHGRRQVLFTVPEEKKKVTT